MTKAAYLLLLVSGAALADDAALLKCRALADSSARLACYDAIPAVSAPVAPAALVAVAAGPAGPAAAPAAAAAPSAPAVAAAPVAAAPAAAPVAARAAEQEFGLAPKKQEKEQAPPSSIESTIAGTNSGWAPGMQVTLANGQVWRILDGNEVVLTPVENRKVRIEKNYFGTLFLVAEGTHHSPKVRRVR